MKVHFYYLLFFLLGSSISLTVTSQTAEELFHQASELLAKKDTKNAIPILQRSAAMGNAEAQYTYGYCFQDGIGVAKNDSLANIWYLLSAQQGFVDAQYKIAYSYTTGRGWKQNNVEAFYWWKQCAEHQDAECMEAVINCFKEGKGTLKNTDSAIVWTMKVAILPDITNNLYLSTIITNARKTLAENYHDGKVVLQSNKTSYMWYLIYNERKQDLPLVEQQKNIGFIKELEKKLSLQEKEQARADAEKQIGRPLKNMAQLYLEENKPEY